MSKVTDTVTALALPVCERCGCELWDVEYVKEAGQWYLRIYIDKPDGVWIADCETVSRELDGLLDEADPIPGSYVLEVSSPGAERRLRRESDFLRYMGQPVTAKLYRAVDGRKEVQGDLAGYAEGNVTLKLGQETVTLNKNDIAQVHLRLV